MKIRNYSIDTLKFFCILGVVCIHTAPFGNMDHMFFDKLASIINTIARVCVPLFFISTGYFFYDKCSKEYSIKYFKKMCMIFLSWSIFYMVYMFCLEMLSNLKNSTLITDGLIELITSFKLIDIYYGTGLIYYHLWYLTALIILIPILYIIIKKNLLEKMIVLALFLNVLGVFLIAFIGIRSYLVRDAIFFGFFYITLGAFINKYEYSLKTKLDNLKISKYISIVIILFVIMIVEKIVYNIFLKGSGDYYISTIPLSILLFVICLINPNILKGSIFNDVGKKTLGIYVIHLLVISVANLILTILNLEYIKMNIVWQLFFTPFVFIASYISYTILHEIKVYLFKG